ncbi:hypothetical protein C8R43DRAFT_1118139 [Mycena crocata]|nr:hypothetical protein C8R43DRAFT_1118139 [Mycena crocata]
MPLGANDSDILSTDFDLVAPTTSISSSDSDTRIDRQTNNHELTVDSKRIQLNPRRGPTPSMHAYGYSAILIDKGIVCATHEACDARRPIAVVHINGRKREAAQARRTGPPRVDPTAFEGWDRQRVRVHGIVDIVTILRAGGHGSRHSRGEGLVEDGTRSVRADNERRATSSTQASTSSLPGMPTATMESMERMKRRGQVLPRLRSWVGESDEDRLAVRENVDIGESGRALDDIEGEDGSDHLRLENGMIASPPSPGCFVQWVPGR